MAQNRPSKKLKSGIGVVIFILVTAFFSLPRETIKNIFAFLLRGVVFVVRTLGIGVLVYLALFLIFMGIILYARMKAEKVRRSSPVYRNVPVSRSDRRTADLPVNRERSARGQMPMARSMPEKRSVPVQPAQGLSPYEAEVRNIVLDNSSNHPGWYNSTINWGNTSSNYRNTTNSWGDFKPVRAGIGWNRRRKSAGVGWGTPDGERNPFVL